MRHPLAELHDFPKSSKTLRDACLSHTELCGEHCLSLGTVLFQQGLELFVFDRFRGFSTGLRGEIVVAAFELLEPLKTL